jgi:ABC-type multidrug transport system fused ATPase/permease subunit
MGAALPLTSALAVAGLGLGAALVKALGGVGSAYGQAKIAGAVGASLRGDVLDRLLSVHRLRRPRHDDHRGGLPRETPSAGGNSTDFSPTRRVSALTACVREVELGLHAGALGGLRAVAQLLPLLMILFWLAPTLALAALLVFVPFAALLGSFRRRWKQGYADAMRHNERLLEAADEAVRHADLWVTYGAEPKARLNVATLGDTIARVSARLEATAAAMSGANEVLGALALVCALCAARAGWLGHTADGAKVLGFAVAFFLAYKPIRDLAEARLAWTRGQAAFEEIEALAPRPEGELQETALSPKLAHEGPDDSTGTQGAVWDLATLEICRLRLARGARTPLTLSVDPGQIVAIVGPTGVGKTTLLRTLLGLEPSQGGDIRYAGSSLADAPAGPAARPFAWVPQDAPLLADTLAANVALGAAADAREALAPLGASHLVDDLGTERLGAGGRAVSGGERQWIALARAIATRQPVLLLDEPTSGLDPESQAAVLLAIARLRGERSVLIVTHRPEPLAIADRVVRLPADAGDRVAGDRSLGDCDLIGDRGVMLS